jgi:hypothetical protein
VREAPLFDTPEPAMRYGVCVVNPLGGHGVIECWCNSHDEAAAEVAKRGGAAMIVGASGSNPYYAGR